MSITFVIDEEQSGIRIDKFLAEAMPDLSRSYIQKLIKEGQVTVNQVPQKANYKIGAGDFLSLEEPELKEPDILAENISVLSCICIVTVFISESSPNTVIFYNCKHSSANHNHT